MIAISVGLLLLFYLECTIGYSFHEEPQDTNVIEGMPVTLRCIVDNWGPLNVLWYDHGNHRYISRDRLILKHSADSERFSIIGDPPSGEYFLHIANTTSQDAGLYSCLLFQDGSFRLSSRDALLQVFPKPSKGFPICSIVPDLTSGGTGPGDWIMLTCVAEGGSPFSRLDWKRSFEILPASYLDENEPRSIYEFRLTEYHNGAVFSCIESNPMLEHTRSCSVMPYYRPTNVTVISTPRRPKIGDSVTVKCNVEAIPNHGFNYTWTLNGQEIWSYEEHQQFSFSDDGSEVTFPSVTEKVNNSIFECNALNVIYLEGRGTLQLTLKQLHVNAGDADSPMVPDDSTEFSVALLVCVVLALLILLAAIVAIILHRHKRAGILDLLKKRRSSLKAKYVEREQYRKTRHDDAESTYSVLICATPSEAIETHLKEISVPPHSKPRKPNHGPPPPPPHRTLSDSGPASTVRTVSPTGPPDGVKTSSRTGTGGRGRSRPTISLPVSVVIPDLHVPLKDLNVKHADTSSVDEDYVSDPDTDWDL